MEQSKYMSNSSHINGSKANNIEENIDPNSTDDVPLDVDLGDPVMYYPYWKTVDEECSVTIKASDFLSYFVNPNKDEFIYHVPGFTDAVRRIHRVVGNAVTEGRYIIGGTGSSQLFNYLLRALSSKVNSGTTNKRIPVVCAAPFYGLFGASVDSEKSAMYEWRGDAHTFDEEGPYIEVVTSPNNPDGLIRKPVVNRPGEMLIHDLAYYWPQYTPTTAPADYDNMLFTMSKFTGHAGSRVGWAIVKDPEIASTMTTQVFLRTIGCCQEGQLRAIKILEFIADSYEKPPIPTAPTTERLFEFGYRVMNERWNKIKAVIKSGNVFNLLEYRPQHCNFLGTVHNPTPAFAWLESKNGDDASQLMSELKIQARNGAMFGSSEHKKCVRITLVGSEDQFNLFYYDDSLLALLH
ncbi:tryptophan aminotransferase-related protein 1-like isoform X1 [Silene latifolia]|uniref:tryptophan aminotransferase-related protein 1-like isoform X1 n=1 Tax=Silene latifolia TaxID=37657 RepID=UPI003D789B68